jgi:hypothetical protein
VSEIDVGVTSGVPRSADILIRSLIRSFKWHPENIKVKVHTQIAFENWDLLVKLGNEALEPLIEHLIIQIIIYAQNLPRF